MHEWGEELIIESYKLPWLIWIQLLILFLILLLLSYFGLFVVIDFTATADPCSSSSSASLSTAVLSFCGVEEEDGGRNCSDVGGNQEAEGENTTGVRRRDEVTREEGSSGGGGGGAATTGLKDLSRLYHPCHYFEIAKQAFLQCLGLETPAARRIESSKSNETQRTNEE